MGGERQSLMEDLMYKKVRAAAVAGWWTLLIGVVFATTAWGVFLMLLNYQPACGPTMWGGASWDTIRTMALWMITVFRLLLWTTFLLVVWLSIWARKLKQIK